MEMCNKWGTLGGVEKVIRDEGKREVVHLSFRNGVTGRITFLEENIFRLDVDPEGEFSVYAKAVDEKHAARIQQRPDGSDAYTKPEVKAAEREGSFLIRCRDTDIIFDKATARMQFRLNDRIVLEEAEALVIREDSAVQTLLRRRDEDFYGGGTQNGRFLHTGRKIRIVNESGWMDGGVASPSPFYFTTAGYGVLRREL